MGQTVDTFRFTWNIYKSNNRKFHRSKTCIQEHVFGHFSSTGHSGFLINASKTFTDKIHPANPLKREDFWVKILKTMALHGVDIEESV